MEPHIKDGEESFEAKATHQSRRSTLYTWLNTGSLQTLPHAEGRGDTKEVISMSKNNNLLSFLAIVSFYSLDVSSSTYQSDFISAGSGATSQIHQYYLEQGEGVVYKVVRVCDTSGFVDEEATYNALVSEISILCHPILQHHPGIIKIKSICWDTPRRSEKVWPIIVLERAEHGSLEKFMQTERGRCTSFRERLNFCLMIVNTIFAMHACNFVHGDIKPHNIVVMAQQTSYFRVKIVDFGFASTVNPNRRNTPLKLPKSVPWNAPEHHHRGFSFEEAKATDIYSLGLLCLWLFFSDTPVDVSLHELLGDSAAAIQEFGQLFQNISLLGSLKSTGKLSQLISPLIETLPLSGEEKTDMIAFLAPMLELDPQARNSNELEQLVDMSPIIPRIRSFSNTRSVIDHGCTQLQIRNLIPILLDGHIRIRTTLVSHLQSQVAEHEGGATRQNAAFQLAICYRIGFGVRADELAVQRCLEIAQKTAEHLYQEISMVQKVFEEPAYRIVNIDHFIDGRRDSSLASIYAQELSDDMTELKIEISDIQEAFGAASDLVYRLKASLWQALLIRRRFEEAKTVMLDALWFIKYGQENDIKAAEEAVRSEEQRSKEIMPGLTLILPDVGPGSSEVASIIAMVNPRNYRSMHVVMDLCWMYDEQFREKEAVWLLIWLHNHYVKLSGQFGHATLRLLELLSSTYQSIGDLDEAKRILKHVLLGLNRDRSPKTMRCMFAHIRLAEILEAQKEYLEVELLLSPLIETAQIMLVPDAVITFRSLHVLAKAYLHQSRYQEAEDLFWRHFCIDKIFSEDQNRDFIALMLEFARHYDMVDDACGNYRLISRALKVGSNTTSRRHLFRSCAQYSLGMTYILEKRFCEAQHMLIPVLEHFRNFFGNDDEATIQTAGLLAETYHALSQCDKEKCLMEKLTADVSSQDDPKFERVLPYVSNRIWCSLRHGRLIQTWKLFWHFAQDILEIRQRWEQFSLVRLLSPTIGKSHDMHDQDASMNSTRLLED